MYTRPWKRCIRAPLQEHELGAWRLVTPWRDHHWYRDAAGVMEKVSPPRISSLVCPPSAMMMAGSFISGGDATFRSCSIAGAQSFGRDSRRGLAETSCKEWLHTAPALFSVVCSSGASDSLMGTVETVLWAWDVNLDHFFVVFSAGIDACGLPRGIFFWRSDKV